MNNVAFFAMKQDGSLFGGKGGTQVAYRKLNYLKSAMTNAGIKDKSEYIFFKASFDKDLLPQVERIEA